MSSFIGEVLKGAEQMDSYASSVPGERWRQPPLMQVIKGLTPPLANS
jgi:hypothetical protein